MAVRAAHYATRVAARPLLLRKHRAATRYARILARLTRTPLRTALRAPLWRNTSRNRAACAPLRAARTRHLRIDNLYG